MSSFIWKYDMLCVEVTPDISWRKLCAQICFNYRYLQSGIVLTNAIMWEPLTLKVSLTFIGHSRSNSIFRVTRVCLSPTPLYCTCACIKGTVLLCGNICILQKASSPWHNLIKKCECVNFFYKELRINQMNSVESHMQSVGPGSPDNCGGSPDIPCPKALLHIHIYPKN